MGHEHELLFEWLGEGAADNRAVAKVADRFRALVVKLAWIRRRVILGRDLRSGELLAIRDDCLGDVNNNSLRNRLKSMECLPSWVRNALTQCKVSVPVTKEMNELKRRMCDLVTPLPAVPYDHVHESVETYLTDLIEGRRAELWFTSLWWRKLYQWEFLVAQHARSIINKFEPFDRSAGFWRGIPKDNSDQESIAREAQLLLLEQSIRASARLADAWRNRNAGRVTIYLSAHFGSKAVLRSICRELGIPFKEPPKKEDQQRAGSQAAAGVGEADREKSSDKEEYHGNQKAQILGRVFYRPDDDVAFQWSSEESDPTEVAELKDCVAHLCAQLSSLDRELLRLRVDEALTFDTIADALNVSRSTCRRRIHELFDRLKDELIGAGIVDPTPA